MERVDTMEEEISLRELLEVLLKRKWLILGITAAAVAAAAIISFFVLSEVYQTQAVMKRNPALTIQVPEDIPQGEGERFIILEQRKYRDLTVRQKVPMEVIQEAVKDSKFLTMVAEESGLKGDPFSLQGKIKIESGENNAANTFKITAMGSTPKEVKTIADGAAKALPRYLADSAYRELEKTQQSIKESLEKIDRAASNAETGQESSTRSEVLKGIRTGLINKYEEIEIIKSIAENEYPVSLVIPASQPTEPIKPKKMLNIAVAAVLGLMVGVFAAFFWEYWTVTSLKEESAQGH
ncbi:MAG: hypothetical protein GX088_05955 [Clostridia bacterium]|nr:hypothetical protein [Clostridia bacterium]